MAITEYWPNVIYGGVPVANYQWAEWTYPPPSSESVAHPMPEIPVAQMTKKQLIRYFAERQDHMAQELEHLNESVDTQLAAAVSQAELIAELKSQLEAAQAAKDAAVAGEEQAQADLTAALDAAEAAADKLDSDDAPADPAPADEA